jgi:NitT/TauT family transport system substrate-binding protein
MREQEQSRKAFQLLAGSLFLAFLSCLSGCGPKASDTEADSGLTQVVLQTDWFPQPEHGGFYQALARGYYREAGLDVTILPGGPNAMTTQKVLKRNADFAMNRADTIYSLVARDVPIMMVMATLQHDPQALLLHASNPISSFEELDGKQVMAIPGLTWITWIEAKYGIQLDIIPHDFGMERFLNDPSFIQQCLLTNEPFYVRQQGAIPKVMPLRESGFDPYHGIYCLREFTENQPGVVERFVHASIRGWEDYIRNDPSPALNLISAKNPKMTAEFMAFSYETMRTQNLVTGNAEYPSQVGQLDPIRLEELVDELNKLGVVDSGIQPALSDWVSTRFLPKPADAPSGELP